MEISNFGRSIFITDSIEERRPDAVFPLFDDESIYFASHLNIKAGDSVVDIGTGSGILAISAAKKARTVLAVDIQDRALHFAQFNAYLNNVDKKIRFIKSDGLGSVQGKFDLVLFNPPFNPAPQMMQGKIFSHGGDDGMRVIRKVFTGISGHIKNKGRLQMITFSLGRDGKPLVFDLIENFFSQRAPRVHFTHLYPPVNHRRIRYFERIFGKKYRAWYKKFDRFPVIYYMLLTLQFDSVTPGFVELPLKAKFVNVKYSGNREARIKRLRCIYRGICE